MSDSSECPVDLEEVAEAYVRYTLSEEQAIAFEDHYATCETCATVLYKTVDYVDAMRAAANGAAGRPEDGWPQRQFINVRQPLWRVCVCTLPCHGSDLPTR